jgi:pimeloyl-ACP methyl ester carboxylesterase/DNA-binding CsgD family transcriptional regulator
VALSIRYARSADGTSIAWAERGHGPAMLTVPSLGITLGYTGPRAAALLEDFRIGAYDRRGTGASSRDVPISEALLTEDCLAVAEHLPFESFHVYANRLGMFEAIHLAAERPERVRGLVLHHPYPQSGWAEHPRQQSWIAAAQGDWDWFAEAFIKTWGDPSPGQPMSGDLLANFKSTNEKASFTATLKTLADWDVSAAVARLRVPTLIIHRAALWHPVEVAESYARTIPGARLVVDHGPEPMHLTEDTQECLREFFTSTMPPSEVPRSWRPKDVHGVEIAAASGLSEREQEVLRLVAGGLSNREIADVLVLAPPTVASHLRSIFEKLGVENRASAAAWAVREGLAR